MFGFGKAEVLHRLPPGCLRATGNFGEPTKVR
jgi:hypothetical protein